MVQSSAAQEDMPRITYIQPISVLESDAWREIHSSPQTELVGGEVGTPDVIDIDIMTKGTQDTGLSPQIQ